MYISTYKVGRNNRIQRLGLLHHANSHGIDQHLVHGDVWKLFAYRRRHFVPENHAVPLGIALGHNSQHLARALLGHLKRKANETGHAVPRKDGHFSRRLPGLPDMRSAALARIFSLAVLTNDDPVEVAGVTVTQRRLRAGQDTSGPNVCVLLEGLADSEAQPPEGNVVWDI